MKPFLLLFAVAFFFASCKKENTALTPDAVPEKTLLNVSYGSDTAQTMDIYLPAGRSADSTQALILIHGGGWSGGDKLDYKDYIAVFKQRLPGYALFNINYRLATYPANNIFPTQEMDVKAAVDTILSNTDEYLFNKNKVALLGASAGAHLALLQAFKYGSPKVRAVVDMFGPTDMADLYNKTSDAYLKFGIEILLSGTPSTNAMAYQESSPINFVTAQSSPTIIFHGDHDPVVPLSESTALQGKLQEASVPVQLNVYPSTQHGWGGANLTDVYNKMEAFLRQYNP